MAKTKSPKLTVDSIKPYAERALKDESFRKDLKDALEAARELYGPLSKSQGGLVKSAKHLATDKKAREQLTRAFEDLSHAAESLQGKKAKTGKGRRSLLMAGVIAGALYNPWTGAQTRGWLLDKIAGDGDLEPLEDLIPAAPEAAVTTDESPDSITP